MNTTLHRLFEIKAEEQPGEPAVVCEGRSWSYLALNRRANRLAHELLNRGVKPGDHVGAVVGRGFGMVAALLAILKCGAAYVPIEPDYPLERKNHLLRHSGAALAITEDGEPLDAAVKVRLRDLDGSALPAHNPEVPVSGQDLAYIMYTSGSTGMPKGVMIEHHSAVNLIQWVNRTLQMTRQDRGLFVTSMCFDLSVYDIFGMLAAGGTIVVSPKGRASDPAELKRLLAEERITFWNSVPTTLQTLVRHLTRSEAGFRQTELRHIYVSGDWVPLDLAASCREYFPKALLTSLGGATEAAVWSIYYPVEQVREEWASIPYGKPIDGNCFYILDEERSPVAPGEIGELYIGGIGLARGYLNDPGKTAEAFLPDPFRNPAADRMYKTGDLGRMLPDGNIEFLGRVDSQVKVRGFRVETREVEKRLLSYPGIREAVVTAKAGPGGGNALHAYFTSGQPLGASGLRDHLAALLPDYMQPSVYIRLDHLPLNLNGKVDVKQLPEATLDTILTDGEFTDCATPLEHTVCAAWERVLGLTGLGAAHNFFEIGGTSVSIVALHAELEKCGLPAAYGDLAAYPTVRGQARRMEELLRGEAASEAGKAEAQNRPGSSSAGSLPKLQPFNDLYYKSCFYNSLFPVLGYFGRSIRSFLCNDLFVYKTAAENALEVLDADWIEERGTEELLKELRLHAEFVEPPDEQALAKRMTEGLRQGKLYIVWVDSFYEPIRRDAHLKRHIPHTLLAYGLAEGEASFYVLEHSHREALNYRERLLDRAALLDGCSGYRRAFLAEGEPYTFIEFAADQPPYSRPAEADRLRLEALYATRQLSIREGIDSLLRYAERYASVPYGEDHTLAEQRIGGLNRIIDGKRAERYRLELMLPERRAALDALDRILGRWTAVRSDLIRLTRGLPLRLSDQETHSKMMREIGREELDVMELMCGSSYAGGRMS